MWKIHHPVPFCNYSTFLLWINISKMNQQQIDPKLASIIVDAVDDSDESDFDEIISHE